MWARGRLTRRSRVPFRESSRSELAYLEAELAIGWRRRAPRREPTPPTTWSLRGASESAPLTVLLSAACFGPIPSAARELAVVAELVHSATLLHDDVIDDSPERRGQRGRAQGLGQRGQRSRGRSAPHPCARSHLRGRSRGALPDLLATLRRLVDGEVVQLRGRAHARRHRGDLLPHPRGQDRLALRLVGARGRHRRRGRQRRAASARHVWRAHGRRVPARRRRARLRGRFGGDRQGAARRSHRRAR